MKNIFTHVLFVCLTGASGLAQSSATINLAVSGTVEELTALEHTKVDFIFGTPEQKRTALTMFATDYHGIGYGADGAGRDNHAAVVEKLTGAFFPAMPPGTFKMSEVQVYTLQPGCSVISYIVSGPGPDGKPWTAFLSSTWVHRGTEWKTAYYQATVLQQP